MPIRISPLDELMEIEKLPPSKDKKIKRGKPEYGMTVEKMIRTPDGQIKRVKPEYGMTVERVVRDADGQMKPAKPEYRAGRIDSDSQPRTPDYKFGPDETAADEIKTKPMAADPQAKPREPKKIQLPRLLEESEIDFNEQIKKLKPKSNEYGMDSQAKPMKPDKIELPDY